MTKQEQLQNAVNISVWHLEDGEPELALETLRPLYMEDESQTAK